MTEQRTANWNEDKTERVWLELPCSFLITLEAITADGTHWQCEIHMQESTIHQIVKASDASEIKSLLVSILRTHLQEALAALPPATT